MDWTLETHTAGDGYRWQYRHYPSVGTTRADVVCIHGIQSHAGWYEGSCRRMARAGYAVSFLDRRGAGVNRAARGDAPGFRRLLADIAEFLTALRSANPGRPTVLLAISWGGKLAAALQRRRPGLTDALALLCPGFCSRIGLSLGQRLQVLAARLVQPRRLFAVPLSDPEFFTSTPGAIRFIREDPLALREATARLLLESARLDGYLRWRPPALTMPTLLLLAERDRIIDNARTRALVAKLARAELTVREYAGAHHTLEFEPEPRAFLDDLLDWLSQRTSSRPDEPR